MFKFGLEGEGVTCVPSRGEMFQVERRADAKALKQVYAQCIPEDLTSRWGKGCTSYKIETFILESLAANLVTQFK